MNRSEFQKISCVREEEALTLLNAGHYRGAYYLVGYAVECALKACVAKQVKQYDFPDKKLANEAFIHDLEKLVRVAGLAPVFEKERQANRALESNWAIVKDWSENSRYELNITEVTARDLCMACIEPDDGILPWIKRRW
jgi:HEPN domain-containing protein